MIVHVYEVPLGPVSDADLHRFTDALDEAERTRLDRFRFQADRKKFACAHFALRTLLGRWRGEPPQSVPIEIASDGKPQLANGPSFSLTHSGGHAMVAIADKGEIGIDFEELRPLENISGMMALVCTNNEQSVIEDVADYDERQRRFFEIWTRKEAVVKVLRQAREIDFRQLETSGPPFVDDPRTSHGRRVYWYRLLPSRGIATLACDQPVEEIHPYLENFCSAHT